MIERGGEETKRDVSMLEPARLRGMVFLVGGEDWRFLWILREVTESVGVDFLIWDLQKIGWWIGSLLNKKKTPKGFLLIGLLLLVLPSSHPGRPMSICPCCIPPAPSYTPL